MLIEHKAGHRCRSIWVTFGFTCGNTCKDPDLQVQVTCGHRSLRVWVLRSGSDWVGLGRNVRTRAKDRKGISVVGTTLRYVLIYLKIEKDYLGISNEDNK